MLLFVCAACTPLFPTGTPSSQVHPVHSTFLVQLLFYYFLDILQFLLSSDHLKYSFYFMIRVTLCPSHSSPRSPLQVFLSAIICCCCYFFILHFLFIRSFHTTLLSVISSVFFLVENVTDPWTVALIKTKNLFLSFFLSSSSSLSDDM